MINAKILVPLQRSVPPLSAPLSYLPHA